MSDPKQRGDGRPQMFIYRGTLPPALALLLVVPLLFVFLSVAAVALAGGAVAALVVPLFLRGRLRRAARDRDVITLERDQYTQIDSDRSPRPRQ